MSYLGGILLAQMGRKGMGNFVKLVAIAVSMLPVGKHTDSGDPEVVSSSCSGGIGRVPQSARF